MSKTTMSEDRTLVERFKQGDEAAFEILVNKYSGRAYQIAYGVLGNREDAEEVAQDVFIRIHRALPRFRGDAEFTTWMYRITMNLAKNKYRWNKIRGSKVNISIDAPLEGGGDGSGEERRIDLPDDRMAPDEKSAFKELEKNVRDELDNLPDIYREALVMRNVEEMSYEDIANALNCKLGTIKSRIARGREELRKRLGL
ncbi:MAG TPA: sigma-70 family RNA polymerase sigma factor [Lentisphaeria bacterium]|nr:sigma-70 family RNA polymerase sigma factor [Lentisphaerota bacterium]OQC15754.1 MAG: ECF RNA polymerase sigma factor SigW [Lentisphaerae bacterium ADurb.Bin082]HPY89753.1 sigma-70 family RNA polymerase sigma factor [Lentisphaeria bacterium]HQC52779.1 sigma-70 family RNA polymerase sigma factor [Lentisphaeria bacterium]HQL88002.1 sigma-70 family RNA polymerase sigma factor [Lentisphaeria bacterium]